MTEPETAHTPLDIPFTFSYRVIGSGWVEADLVAGSNSVHLSASYLSDALTNLLTAVEHILDGGEESEAFWDEEPGHFHWVFARTGSSLRMRVLVESGTRRAWPQRPWIAPRDTITHASGYGPEYPPEFGIVELTGDVSVIASIVTAAAAHVLSEEGEIGYWVAWASKRFPTQQLWRMQDKLGMTRTSLPEQTPPGPDPVRELLIERWESFLSGASSAEETWQAIDSGEYYQRSTTPVVRFAVRTLRWDARSGEWALGGTEDQSKSYEQWRARLDLYDRDPSEWKRQVLIGRLRDSINLCSDFYVESIAAQYRDFLSDEDIQKIVARRRPRRPRF
jgi:hypothetical protein